MSHFSFLLSLFLFRFLSFKIFFAFCLAFFLSLSRSSVLCLPALSPSLSLSVPPPYFILSLSLFPSHFCHLFPFLLSFPSLSLFLSPLSLLLPPSLFLLFLFFYELRPTLRPPEAMLTTSPTMTPRSTAETLRTWVAAPANPDPKTHRPI